MAGGVIVLKEAAAAQRRDECVTVMLSLPEELLAAGEMPQNRGGLWQCDCRGLRSPNAGAGMHN